MILGCKKDEPIEPEPDKPVEKEDLSKKISIEDINIIAIGWDYPNLCKMFGAKFISKKEMSKVILGTEKYADKIMYVEHHIAHACSAFYPSGFEKALVLVIDGQGEYIATSVFLGDKKKNKLNYI